ncbi:MAG: valine--pyruvate transaminase [Deltaproteobacteria bacterium]|nr:valine--pyruvate transaminase [Deltaproteobacteria bacterium]
MRFKNLNLSKFGQRFCSETGIWNLMDDLGKAMHSGGQKLMLGGGNPAAIPIVRDIWRQRMAEILADQALFDSMLGDYHTPQGTPEFLDAIVKLFHNQYGWKLSRENIAVTPGSQMAFYYLVNLLAGEQSDGSFKKILLPLMPEYIGYADQGQAKNIYQSYQPQIDYLDRHTFKYRVDFSSLKLSSDIAGVLVSRPTNPTGNVLTVDEVSRLAQMTKDAGVPLIIDNAYGHPFPDIIFSDITPVWDERIILSMSLSKIGLPGIRTGFVIAQPEVIQAISALNAILALANVNVGQQIITPLIASGEIMDICKNHVRTFYFDRSRLAIDHFHSQMPDSIPYYLHKCEGAMFLWLWLKDSPLPTRELYERLKQRNVIVVPGEYFFFGLDDPWPHTNQCLRINYSHNPQMVKEGLSIIAEECRKIY